MTNSIRPIRMASLRFNGEAQTCCISEQEAREVDGQSVKTISGSEGGWRRDGKKVYCVNWGALSGKRRCSRT